MRWIKKITRTITNIYHKFQNKMDEHFVGTAITFAVLFGTMSYFFLKDNNLWHSAFFVTSVLAIEFMLISTALVINQKKWISIVGSVVAAISTTILTLAVFLVFKADFRSFVSAAQFKFMWPEIDLIVSIMAGAVLSTVIPRLFKHSQAEEVEYLWTVYHPCGKAVHIFRKADDHLTQYELLKKW